MFFIEGNYVLNGWDVEHRLVNMFLKISKFNMKLIDTQQKRSGVWDKQINKKKLNRKNLNIIFKILNIKYKKKENLKKIIIQL